MLRMDLSSSLSPSLNSSDLEARPIAASLAISAFKREMKAFLPNYYHSLNMIAKKTRKFIYSSI